MKTIPWGEKFGFSVIFIFIKMGVYNDFRYWYVKRFDLIMKLVVKFMMCWFFRLVPNNRRSIIDPRTIKPKRRSKYHRDQDLNELFHWWTQKESHELKIKMASSRYLKLQWFWIKGHQRRWRPRFRFHIILSLLKNSFDRSQVIFGTFVQFEDHDHSFGPPTLD